MLGGGAATCELTGNLDPTSIAGMKQGTAVITVLLLDGPFSSACGDGVGGLQRTTLLPTQ